VHNKGAGWLAGFYLAGQSKYNVAAVGGTAGAGVQKRITVGRRALPKVGVDG